MQKKILFLFALAACADLSIKKDYVVVDAKDTSYPKWVKDEGRQADEKFAYFVSTGGDVNKDLCQKSSEARAAATISAEISQSITDNFTQNSKSSGDDSSVQKQEELKQEIQRNLSGVQVEGRFWERRKYQESLGADKDYSRYHCWTLLKIDSKAYAKVMADGAKKLGESVAAPAVEPVKAE